MLMISFPLSHTLQSYYGNDTVMTVDSACYHISLVNTDFLIV
jgi:hypothetical protein